MPPRIPLIQALSRTASLFRSQACQFTQKAPSLAGLRQNVPSATSSLMNLDSASPSNPKDATENASGIFDSYRSQKTRTPAGEERKDLLESQLGQKNLSENFQRQMPRRWQDGEVYAPHDLSEVEARKWKKVTNVQRDLVDMLGLRPVDMYSNFSVVSEFMTPHGRIKKRNITGLKPKNQRKVAKMVRRAIGLGIHPSVHRHPELLMREGQMSQAQTSATVMKGSYI